MSIELQKGKHREAIASIVRYFQEQREPDLWSAAGAAVGGGADGGGMPAEGGGRAGAKRLWLDAESSQQVLP